MAGYCCYFLWVCFRFPGNICSIFVCKFITSHCSFFFFLLYSARCSVSIPKPQTTVIKHFFQANLLTATCKTQPVWECLHTCVLVRFMDFAIWLALCRTKYSLSVCVCVLVCDDDSALACSACVRLWGLLIFLIAHNRGSVSYTCRQTPEETCDDGKTVQFAVSINWSQVCPINIYPNSDLLCSHKCLLCVAEKSSHDFHVLSALVGISH